MSASEVTFKGARGVDENLPIVLQHSVYPAIDPTPHFRNKSFAGKVVLITGASRGIGADISIHFAKAGASVAIMSRGQRALEDTKKAILEASPSAQVITYAVDVVDHVASESAINMVIERFGRLDVLVANAGALTPMNIPIENKDPELWWRTFEVNIRGVFNFVRPCIPHLKNTGGHVIAISSGAAQVRMPGVSDYNMSKHALNRFVEYIALENPNIKAFSLHPGRIRTALAEAAKMDPSISMPDETDLPSATALYLAAGNADWLSGRYVSSNWDLSVVERDWKDKILEKDALVNKLLIP